MNIDALNERVTEAILRAEALEVNGPSADVSEAYLVVSFYEEEIAELLPASDEEGAIARRGAVRAALVAGVPERAMELVERYAFDAAAPRELIEELRQMGARAEAELDLPTSPIPVIPAARYQLQDAA